MPMTLPRYRRATLFTILSSGFLLLLALAGDAGAFLRPAAPSDTNNPKGASTSASATGSVPENGKGAHQARRALELEEIYDRTNPDWQRLQKIDEATRHLPHDNTGFPDWMRALREGKIKLRHDIRGNSSPELLDLDVIMRNTKEMPYVRFPHLPHTQHLACSNCHPSPFLAQKGTHNIQMSDIFRGKYCGMCHDRVAFITFYSCDRCHSVRPEYDAIKP